MGLAGGLVAIAVAAFMLVVGAPRKGIDRPLVRNWTTLITYVMVIEIMFVGGVAALITNW